MKFLEIFIESVFTLFIGLIKTLDRVLGILSGIIKILICVALGVLTIDGIRLLPSFWQPLVLGILMFGLVASYISIFALFFWKPDKFSEILGKFEK